MRRTVTIALSTGTAIAVLGGGLAMASDDRSRPAVSSAPSRAAAPSATISRARAKLLALQAVPGGHVRSIEAEQEHGRAIWSVKVVARGVRHDVQIDRRTGKALRDRTGHGTQADGTGHDAGDDHGRDDHGRDDDGRHDTGDDHGRHGGTGHDDDGHHDGGHGENDG